MEKVVAISARVNYATTEEVTQMNPEHVAVIFLERAIHLYLSGEFEGVVLAMAHPAHLLFKDLAQKKHPESFAARGVFEDLRKAKFLRSDGKPVETLGDFFSTLHRDANSQKHLSDDLTATHERGSELATIILAVVHAEQLHLLTGVMLLFLNWVYAIQGSEVPELAAQAARMFPELQACSSTEQLQVGLTELAKIYTPPSRTS